MDSAVAVAVIGAGYMGLAHARVLSRIASEYPGLLELRYIVDIDYARARLAAARYGGEPLDTLASLPKGSVDLAIVAVPTRAHANVVLDLLKRGVTGFLVEKPLAASVDEAVALAKRLEREDAWVSVGHVERFNPALMRLYMLLREGAIGSVHTFTSRRVGPFAPRAGDTDVVYDLGVHEVDAVASLSSVVPFSVRAYTLGEIVSGLNDYALIVAGIGEGYASIEVNRITPFKQRLLYVTGQKGVAMLDYMARNLKLYRSDSVTTYSLRDEEPLYIEDLAVVTAFSRSEQPPVDLAQGAAAMLVCGAALASASLRNEVDVKRYAAQHNMEHVLEEAAEGYRRYYGVVERLRAELGLW